MFRGFFGSFFRGFCFFVICSAAEDAKVFKEFNERQFNIDSAEDVFTGVEIDVATTEPNVKAVAFTVCK